MSTFDSRTVGCTGCGHPFEATVYSSVSTHRMPQAPDWIVERTFQRASCPRCDTLHTVVQPVLYVDFEGGLWAHCLPEPERLRWWEHEGTLAETLTTSFHPDNAPPIARHMADRVQKRVTFGYEELREKILCIRHGLDDGLLECLKLQILLQTPVMASDGVVTLSLEAVEEEHLVFTPLFPPAGPRREVALSTMRVPRSAWQATLEARASLERHHRSLFGGGGWRNALRYVIPRPTPNPGEVIGA